MFAQSILLGALLSLSALGCKTMNESASETLAGQAKAKPASLSLSGSNSVDIDWKNAPIVPVTVVSEKDGLAMVEVSVVTGDKKQLASPPKISFSDGSKKIAVGNMFVAAGRQGYYSGKIIFDAKAKKNYSLVIDHGGVLKGSTSIGSIYGTYREANKQKSNTFSEQEQFYMQDRFSQLKIPLKMKVEKEGAIHISLSSRMEPINIGIQDSFPVVGPCGCELTVTLSEKGKTFSIILKEQNGGFDGQLNYDLPVGTYDFEVSASKAPADFLLELIISLQRSHIAISRPTPVSVLQMGFNQNNSKTGKLGNKPFGFAIDSDLESEGKIDITVNVTRFLNKADLTKAFPETANFGLYQNTPPTTPKTPPIGALGLQSSGTYYRGAFVWDFEESKYFLLSDPSVFDPNDQVELQGNMAISDLTIKDGGEPLSAFTDMGAVTVTPPANYTDDQDPKIKPFPKVTPVKMAMKSVLSAMEQVRNVFHQRVPKGIKRGPSNAIDPNTILACLGNPAEHWSDIMIHYYCQHGQARACYTNTVRAGASRKDAFDQCKTDAAFKWVADNQGDVFRYLMMSQTFAFDVEQQQRVINAFYRINKPEDKQECLKKRPRRAIDPSDGTHCLASKVYPSTPLRSVGR